jgi:hypothetical protein
MTESTILTIGAWRYDKDIFTNHESVTYLINNLISDKAVYRTAPATPGLLKVHVCHTARLMLSCPYIYVLLSNCLTKQYCIQTNIFNSGSCLFESEITLNTPLMTKCLSMKPDK